MITLRALIMPAVIAISLSFMSGHTSAESSSNSLLVSQPRIISAQSRQIYIDNGSAKMKLSDGSLSWQISLLHGDTGAVTNNIEINLIDKDSFIIRTLSSICLESKPFSLTLFRGRHTLYSDVKEIKTLIVKTKPVGKDFCNGYGVDKGEPQVVGDGLTDWIRTATLSEYLTLTTSN